LDQLPQQHPKKFRNVTSREIRCDIPQLFV
jgi:hypothetical protein